MKIGLLGLISSDLTDVSYDMLRFAADLGFQGVGAHLSVPADRIAEDVAARVPGLFKDQKLDLFQLAGPYPPIISRDEDVRAAGVRGAQNVAKLAARMGVKESLVRPTSMSPRGDYSPHRDNYLPETEERLVRSISEVLEVAEPLGVDIALEAHMTTTLRSPEVIRRVIEKTGSKHLKVNMDLCNFMGDLAIAFNPAPFIHHAFDLLGDYISMIHLKDFYFEDRLVVHVSETVIGTGELDFAPILQRAHAWNPAGYLVIEHLPMALVPLAKRNLNALLKAGGYPLG
jgi:sugar phosphate isomerase/epimerase